MVRARHDKQGCADSAAREIWGRCPRSALGQLPEPFQPAGIPLIRRSSSARAAMTPSNGRGSERYMSLIAS